MKSIIIIVSLLGAIGYLISLVDNPLMIFLYVLFGLNIYVWGHVLGLIKENRKNGKTRA